jgi:hypothetical protein
MKVLDCKTGHLYEYFYYPKFDSSGRSSRWGGFPEFILAWQGLKKAFFSVSKEKK